jgi:hypothetical protein
MSITHTSEELINQAAAILGKYIPGEALSDVEHSTLSSAVDNTLAEIEKIVSVDREQVPNVLFETIAYLVAAFAAAAFSNVPRDKQTIENWEQRLRYLVAQTPTYEPVQAYFF